MKFLIISLSAVFGTLSGMIFDLQIPVVTIYSLPLSGPAFAIGLAVFSVIASLLIGIHMVLSRIDIMMAKQHRQIEPDLSGRPAPSMRSPVRAYPRDLSRDTLYPSAPLRFVPHLPNTEFNNLELRAKS